MYSFSLGKQQIETTEYNANQCKCHREGKLDQRMDRWKTKVCFQSVIKKKITIKRLMKAGRAGMGEGRGKEVLPFPFPSASAGSRNLRSVGWIDFLDRVATGRERPASHPRP